MVATIDDGFFGLPPRPPGRGWWRRLRHALAWLCLGVAVGGGLSAGVWHEVGERAESKRIAAHGERRECRILSRRSTSGKSPSYYVTLQTVDGRSPGRIEVQVTRSDWSRAGGTTPYYWDPVAGRGVAEIERTHRESLGGAIVMAIIAVVAVIASAAGLRRALREMRLFRLGRELHTHGGGLHVRVTHEGFEMNVAPPADRSSLIRVGATGGELTLLASDDLSSHFFPQLRDVPVERLTRDEMIVAVLEAPVRRMRPAWREWLRRKYRGFLIAMSLVAGVAGITLLAVGAGAGAGTPFWIVAGVAGGLELILALAWMRRFWRDIVLWREGDEVHAVVLHESWENNYRTYTLGFTHRQAERRATLRVPDAFSLLRVPSPPDAPAVTNRAVVLVDPAFPRRWAAVPESCAR